MKKACPKTGRVCEPGCRACKDHTWRGEPGGSSRAWRKLRDLVLERDGYRCTAMIDNARCTRTFSLEIHHLDPDGPRLCHPSRLTTLCREHHGLFR